MRKCRRIIAFLDQREKEEYKQTWERRHGIVEISKQEKVQTEGGKGAWLRKKVKEWSDA